MQRSMIAFCFVVFSAGMLFARNPEKDQKRGTAEIKQAAAANKSVTQNSNSTNTSGVSFVNSNGDTLLQVQENGIVKADTVVADSLNISGTVAAGAFIGDGSGLTNLPNSGWGLTGNSGTDTTINFIGTTDNMPLDFRVNNVRALRLEYSEIGPGYPTPIIIGGFSGNTASDGADGATIAGGGLAGDINAVTQSHGTIGGGFGNTVGGESGTVGGGERNNATGSAAFIGGGTSNTSSGNEAAVSGGRQNRASGENAAVPGGRHNTASGAFSFAAGYKAKANHHGAFVWADNRDIDFSSTAEKQFLIRASGGVGINKNNPVAELDVNGIIVADSLYAGFLFGDGSGLTNLSNSGWGLTGNNGTDTTINFIGTTDDMPLDFRVNSERALRLEYAETSEGSVPAPNIIGGYSGNFVSSNAYGATISGGGAATVINTVTAGFGTVGGGAKNTASGRSATVAGGWQNQASGDYSFAIGKNANANHHGAFVWADNANADFSSTGTKQFLIRAGGGVGINKNNPASELDVNGTVTATAFVGDGSGLTGISGDDLGNHIATQTLDLNSNDITNGGTLTATAFLGDGSGLSGIAGDDLGNHIATQTLDLNSNDISNGGTVAAAAFVGDGSGLTGISGDDLGNHSAAQNLSLNGNYLSNDGGNEGILITDNGQVGIGTTSGALLNNLLTVDGTAKFSGIGINIFPSSTPTGMLEADPDGIPNNGDEFVVDNDGNVGIGTQNPNARLQANANINTLTALSLGYSGPQTISAPALLKISQNNGFNDAIGMEVDVSGSTATNKYAAIFKGGSVGIGTATPGSPLHVSDTGDPMMRIENTGNTGGNRNVSLRFFHSNGEGARINALRNSGVTDGMSLAFFTRPNGGAVSERLRIDPGGKVGIGTAAPANRLSVSGDADFSGSVGLGTTNPSNRLTVNGTADFTNNVAIGTSIPHENRLIVEQAQFGVNSSSLNYVTRITNTTTNATNEKGVLALQFNVNLNGSPGKGNWIQFFENSTDLAGKIENNNNGNVQYVSGGSDYAELLERLDHAEEINAGDVVGVFGGKISKRTDSADWVMAISDQAIVLGNAIYDGTEENYEIVSFIGQVPVFVRGMVNKGDYIVASGNNDGTAIAVSPQKLQPEQGRLIVGRAWEAKAAAAVARVNTVVGLPGAASTTMALTKRMKAQQEAIAKLQAQNQALAAKIASHENRFAEIEAMLLKLKSKIELTSTK